MGLDIYVGSFTRYYAHQWETIVQQAGRADGISVEIVRTEPTSTDAISDPDQINAGILQWRQGLGTALRNAGVIAEDLDWDERLEAPYYTDKPAWDCFGALNLLAAYEEEPKPLFGNRFPKDFKQDWDRDGRLNRHIAGKGSRYSHLYGCEVWLPVDLANSFDGPRPTGPPTRFGSSVRLHQQMLELNNRTYRGSADDRVTWRKEMPDGGDPAFEPKAKTGLAIVLGIAGAANENRLPMILDY